jgi:Ran GTPase-activating protein (RanGAP) involved in mRNA processing and transport
MSRFPLTRPRAYAVNTTLTSLDLQNNYKIGGDGAKGLAAGLKVNKSLKKLNLQGSIDDKDGLMALADALRGNRTLEELSLYFNGVDDDVAAALADALLRGVPGCCGSRAVTGLTTLTLTQNQIHEAGAVAIGQALKGNSTLRELRLNINIIGGAGAAAIFAALNGNKTLRILALGQSEIKDGGASGLTSLGVLEELDLFNCEVGDDTAVAVAKALASNTTLTKLNLGSDAVTDVGATALATALKTNKTLIDLNLACNKAGVDGVTALGEALRVNCTMRKLDVGYNEGVTAKSPDEREEIKAKLEEARKASAALEDRAAPVEVEC